MPEPPYIPPGSTSPATAPPGMFGFLSDIVKSYLQGGGEFGRDPLRAIDRLFTPPTSVPGMRPQPSPSILPGEVHSPSMWLDPGEQFSNLVAPGVGTIGGALGAPLVMGGIKKGLFGDMVKAVTGSLGKKAVTGAAETAADPSRRAFLKLAGSAAGSAVLPKGTVKSVVEGAASPLPKLRAVADDPFEFMAAIKAVGGHGITDERASPNALEVAELVANQGYKLVGLAPSPGSWIARVEGKGGKIADVVLSESDQRWDRSLQRAVEPIVKPTGTSMLPEGVPKVEPPESVMNMVADSLHDTFVEKGYNPKVLRDLAKFANSEVNDVYTEPMVDVIEHAINVAEHGIAGPFPPWGLMANTQMSVDEAKAILTGKLDPKVFAKPSIEKFLVSQNEYKAGEAARKSRVKEFEKGVDEGYSRRTSKEGPLSEEDMKKKFPTPSERRHTEELKAASMAKPDFTTRGTLHPMVMRHPSSFSAYAEDPHLFLTNYWQDFLTSLEKMSPGMTRSIGEKSGIIKTQSPTAGAQTPSLESLVKQLLGIPAPPVDLNAPIHSANARFLGIKPPGISGELER